MANMPASVQMLRMSALLKLSVSFLMANCRCNVMLRIGCIFVPSFRTIARITQKNQEERKIEKKYCVCWSIHHLASQWPHSQYLHASWWDLPGEAVQGQNRTRMDTGEKAETKHTGSFCHSYTACRETDLQEQCDALTFWQLQAQVTEVTYFA